jgi:hypothetical protein
MRSPPGSDRLVRRRTRRHAEHAALFLSETIN